LSKCIFITGPGGTCCVVFSEARLTQATILVPRIILFSASARCPKCKVMGNVHGRKFYEMSGKMHLSFTFNRTKFEGSTGECTRILTPLTFPASLTVDGVKGSFKPLVVVFFTGCHYFCLLRADSATNSEVDDRAKWILFDDCSVRATSLDFAFRSKRASQICQVVYIPS